MMSETCAVCGVASVYRTVAPPHEWRAFLRRRRHLKDAEGYVSVPACRDCFFRVENLIEAEAELDHYDRETRRRFEREIEDLLENIHLEQLLTDEAEEP